MPISHRHKIGALRPRLESAIEHLIALLDAVDGDPDMEPNADHELDVCEFDDCEDPALVRGTVR